VPQSAQNVVTYTVVVAVANPGAKLLPGMTANVKFVTAERTDAVKVANMIGVESGARFPRL
jgi:HlyD family secretion protein